MEYTLDLDQLYQGLLDFIFAFYALDISWLMICNTVFIRYFFQLIRILYYRENSNGLHWKSSHWKLILLLDNSCMILYKSCSRSSKPGFLVPLGVVAWINWDVCGKAL